MSFHTQAKDGVFDWYKTLSNKEANHKRMRLGLSVHDFAIYNKLNEAHFHKCDKLQTQLTTSLLRAISNQEVRTHAPIQDCFQVGSKFSID